MKVIKSTFSSENRQIDSLHHAPTFKIVYGWPLKAESHKALWSQNDNVQTSFLWYSWENISKKKNCVAKLDKKAAEFITNYTKLEFFSYLVFKNVDDSEFLSGKFLALNVFLFRLGKYHVSNVEMLVYQSVCCPSTMAFVNIKITAVGNFYLTDTFQ